MKTRFYYSQLTHPRAKELYDKILAAIKDRKTSAKVEMTNLKHEDGTRIIRAFEYDNPELFYVTFYGEDCGTVEYGNGDFEVRFRYLLSPEEEKKRIRDNQAFIDYLISHLPESVKRSKYETALWLHDTLIRNLTYDHEACDVGSEKKPDAYTIMGGISEKTAVCAGISKLYQMLCEQEGIWCIYVSGESVERTEDGKEETGERHAWNMIRLGKYYAYVDVTWDLKDDSDERMLQHTYFGMSDIQCRQKHVVKGGEFDGCLPRCVEHNPLNYYIQRGAYIRSFRQLEQFVQRMAQKKRRQFSFQMDPQGMDPQVLKERTQAWMGAWIRKYMKEDGNTSLSWTWWSNVDMMVFEYHVT